MNTWKCKLRGRANRWFCFYSALQIVAALLILLSASAWAEKRPEPFNKLVIIVDNSGSFSEKQSEAIDRTIALLDALSSRKLHRWEKDKANDEITLISLDAIPEVIWRGSLPELKILGSDFWTARFKSRTDYSGCTDVTGAFRLAAKRLDGNPRYVRKYLFVFSDLVHQPPTDSIYKPGKPSRLPGDDFPWEVLRDISVSVLWVPGDQKLAWRRAVEQHGLESSFALYTTSESSEVEIKPPPRAELELTKAELKADRQRYIGYGKKLAGGLGIILLVFILAVSAIAFGLSRYRRGPSNNNFSAEGIPINPAQQKLTDERGINNA